MLASALVLGVVAGLLAGGRASRLAELHIRWWPLLVGGLALRLIAPAFGEFAAILYVAGFAGVVAVAAADRAIAGMPLIALGAALNALVVAANGGMPVDPGALEAAGAAMPDDRLHILLDETTRLAPLADVIPLAVVRSVYSIGDVVLAAGGFWVPFAWLRRR